MGKIRGGYLIKHRIQTIFRWSSPMGYRFLDSPSPPKPISRFCRWTRNLQSKIKSICCGSKNMVSVHAKGEEQTSKVPKGYMPVYVGRKDGDFDRVLVPVIYFNDPLFGQLLRDAEEEFGYDHPGAITIPCNISEFEHVRTRIKERTGTRKIFRSK